MTDPNCERLISVIIPTFNRANFLSRAVKSVLLQTQTHFELIIVDDASIDHTKKIIREFKDPRIKFISFLVHKGGQSARNAGIKKARGEFIAFLDDDDEWKKEKLEKELGHFLQCPEKVGVVYSGSEVIDKRKNAILRTNIPSRTPDMKYQLLFGPVIGSVSYALIRKNCFDDIGLFDESLKSCQDWDIWRRIANRYEITFIPEVLTTTYQHDNQISNDIDAVIQGRKQILNKYWQELRQYPHIKIIHLKTIGKLYCLRGLRKEAWGYFKETLKINPVEIFKIIMWCLFDFPGVKRASRFIIRKKPLKKIITKTRIRIPFIHDQPLVSVIIPTRNRANMLKKSIQSALDQTYTHIEIIIVDDASTDRTHDIICEIKDPRIKYIKHQKTKGGSAARNTGIKMSQGDYIALIDDDDEWNPNKIALCLKKFNDVAPNVGIIYSGSETYERRGDKLLKRSLPAYKGDLTKPLRLGPTVCGLNSTLIKKECFEKIGLFDESLKSCQDWDMWKRISQEYAFDYVNDILARINFHKSQISKDLDAVITGREQILKKYSEEYKYNPQDLIIHYKSLGKLYSIKNDRSNAFRYFYKVVQMNFIEIFKILAWYMLEYRNVKKIEYHKMYD
ncbi:MAG: glycosyltransferase [Candidatus Omnitrophica bacterium]|nr:glycosyltransferase [Candidatus Omnitrophota bacterium]